MNKVANTLIDLRLYVDKKETSANYSKIRNKLDSIDVYADDVIDYGEKASEYIDDEISHMNDLGDLCPDHVDRYSSWYYKKIDILDDLADTNGELLEEIEKMQSTVIQYIDRPDKLLRMLNSIKEELDEISKR